MIDRNLGRGLFLALVALGFGLGALRYPVGSLSHAGPGFFPLMVSVLLMLLAVCAMVQSRFVERKPMNIKLKNISLILLSLAGFVGVSKLIDMVAGIVFLVFVSGFAASSYSWQRNVKISLALIAVAFAFQKLLGLNLPLL
jgi:Tripartite tricarboxylate transporter TctB family